MKIRGHESFYLRKGWLQKGVKNILIDNRIFNDKDLNACDVLGIGINMVKSMKYWLLATNVVKEKKENNKRIMILSDLGEIIDKYDKYYEEIGTNLIIHYQLATNIENATSWYWFFNEYDESIINKQRFEEELNYYIEHVLNEKPSKVLDDEYNCIVKTYIAVEKEDIPEETKVCPLAELGLLEFIGERSKEIRKKAPEISDIHPLIAFAFIVDYAKGRDEVSIEELLNSKNSIGKILNLSRTILIELLNLLSSMKYLKIERTAGLDIVKILKQMEFLDVVELYYRELNGEKI